MFPITKPTVTGLFLLAGGLAVLAWTTSGQVHPAPSVPGDAYGPTIRPLLVKYCLDCHSTKAKKGSLDLERFATVADIRQDIKPWQHMIEQIETGEMPPKGKAQPREAEKKQLLDWVRGFLDAEARARSGDPGQVPLRRLSNAEYDATIRDLTGVDLKPTREFPADGAAGEGFTNAGESLSDISPALFSRYLQAAKEIADHAVLLPDGFRFSPSKTRRDWTDEGTVRLRKYYSEIWPVQDGSINRLQHYLLATVRHREALAAGKFEMVAAKEGLNAKYLGILWQTLNDKKPSEPLDTIRAIWRNATEKDVDALFADVKGWQAMVWRTVKVGNYVRGSWGQGPESGNASRTGLLWTGTVGGRGSVDHRSVRLGRLSGRWECDNRRVLLARRTKAGPPRGTLSEVATNQSGTVLVVTLSGIISIRPGEVTENSGILVPVVGPDGQRQQAVLVEEVRPAYFRPPHTARSRCPQPPLADPSLTATPVAGIARGTGAVDSVAGR